MQQTLIRYCHRWSSAAKVEEMWQGTGTYDRLMSSLIAVVASGQPMDHCWLLGPHLYWATASFSSYFVSGFSWLHCEMTHWVSWPRRVISVALNLYEHLVSEEVLCSLCPGATDWMTSQEFVPPFVILVPQSVEMLVYQFIFYTSWACHLLSNAFPVDRADINPCQLLG